jgi:hypothetical protein
MGSNEKFLSACGLFLPRLKAGGFLARNVWAKRRIRVAYS